VLVEADAQTELRRASVALIFQLSVVDQRFIRDRLGAVSEAILNAIWTAFDELTERR
jgi:hypothetical protein